MVIGMLWIVGVFGLSAASIHLLKGWQLWKTHRSIVNKPRLTTYAVLETCNNELQIEWYIRSFLFVSWLRGRLIQITLFDQGSSDETLRIVTKLANTRDNLKIEASIDGLNSIDRMTLFMEQHKEDAVIVLHLTNRSANEPWSRERWLKPYW